MNQPQTTQPLASQTAEPTIQPSIFQRRYDNPDESLFNSQAYSATASQAQRISTQDQTMIFKVRESFIVTNHIYSNYKKGRVSLRFKGCYSTEENARNAALSMAKSDDEHNEFSCLKKWEGGVPGPLDLEDVIVSYFSMKLTHNQTTFSESIDFDQEIDKIHSIETTRFYSVIRVRQLVNEEGEGLIY